MSKVITSNQESNVWAAQLESIYNRYGAGIYLLCLRLLANKEAAESATAKAFVRFCRELPGQTDESHMRIRLRELAIEATLTRLRKYDIRAMFRQFCDVLLTWRH